jgi:AcrR family transcriptional regulator
MVSLESDDGRRRRSETSRARIVAAMLALVRATAVSPSAEQVAERAGVGLRSVFRHFRDMESLYREMSAAIEAELRAVAALPFEGRSWRERVMELIARRGVAFDRIAPFRLASDARVHASEVLRGDRARMAQVARELLRLQLPAEVAADAPLFEALDLLLSFEAWRRLRADQSLGPDEARAVLERAVRALIGED